MARSAGVVKKEERGEKKMKRNKNKTRYELTMKAYSYLLILAMIATIVITPLGGLGLWATADEEQICDHVHAESCYAVPLDHVCSIENGCEPVYPMKTVETDMHTHTDECFGTIVVVPGHVHDESCYDGIGEELGALICGLFEGEGEVVAYDYNNPLCGMTDGEVETAEISDTDAEPIGWICKAEKTELICEHAGCTPGEICLAAAEAEEIEEENVDAGMRNPMGIMMASGTVAETMDYLEFSETATEATIENFNYQAGLSPTEIVIPAMHNGLPVTRIANDAFAACGLTEVLFEDGLSHPLTTIGNRAFQSNPFTGIELPSAVNSIGTDAFNACSSLLSIDLSYLTGPSGLKAIPTGCFYNCTSLTEAKLPDGLLTIGGNAFRACPMNSGIKIPGSVTAINGTMTFTSMAANSIIDLTEHEPGSLAGAPWLARNAILKWAPSGYTNSTDFIFNEDTGYICGIKDTVTGGVGSLDLIIPKEINGKTVVGLSDGAFGSRPANRLIGSVAFETGTAITRISEYCFLSAVNLKSIDLPEGITSIENSAIRDCTSAAFTSVVLPESLETIGVYAFNGDFGLTSVKFSGDQVKSIASDAFIGCNAIKHIYLEEMDKDSVAGAPWLANYASVHWKDGKTDPPLTAQDDTGNWEFMPAEGRIVAYVGTAYGPAVDLTVPSALYYDGTSYPITLFGDTGGTVVFASGRSFRSLTFEDGILSIEYAACRNIPIGTLNLGNTVETLGPESFRGCGLTHIDLPDSITTIGARCFQNNALTGELVIPGNMASVDVTAFTDNPGITQIIIKQYRTLLTDEGAEIEYDDALKLYKHSPTNVQSRAPFGATNAASQVFFMDDPKPVGSHTVTANTTANTATIHLSAVMNLPNVNINDVDNATGSPAVSNVDTYPFSGGSYGSATADMAISATNGNGEYVFVVTFGSDNKTYEYRVAVDLFHKITYVPNGGTAPIPSDSGNYVQGYSLALASGTLMTAPASTVFLGWTLTPNPALVTSQTAEDALNIITTYIFGTSDATVYAAWARDMNGDGVPDYKEGKFTVKYDGNGAMTGSPPPTETESSPGNELIGTDVVDLSDGCGTLALPGYVFYGWSSEAVDRLDSEDDASALTTIVTTLTMDEDYFDAGQTWEYIVYAVWAKDANGTGKPDFEETLFSVTYIANGAGSGNVPVDNYPYAEPTTISGSNPDSNKATILGNVGLPPLTKTGSAFTGWNTETDGSGDAYAAGATVFIDDDLILYAQWSGNKYNITYAYTGTVPTGAAALLPSTVTGAEYGTTRTVAEDPSLDGYAFSGWTTTDATVSGGSFTMPDNAVEFTGSWTAKSVTVTYQNNYTGASEPYATDDSGDYNTTIAAPTTPTRTGYVFGGWYKEAACTTPWFFAGGTNGDAAVTGTAMALTSANGVATASTSPALTLYAKWTAKFVTITFNRNTTDTGSTDGAVTTLTTKVYGGTIGPDLPSAAPNIPKRPGYTFTGWNTLATGLGTPYSTATELTTANGVNATPNPATLTLYAVWEKIDYKITFKANGGTGADVVMSSINIGATIVLPTDSDFTNYPKDIAGFDTSGTATTPLYNGVSFTLDAAAIATLFPISDEVVLFVIWEDPLPIYTLTYDPNGGSGNIPVDSGGHAKGDNVTLQGNAGTPQKLTRTGYTFGGWSLTKTGAAVSAVTFSDDNITVYAVWELKEYTIEFKANGGVATPAGTHTWSGNIGGEVKFPDLVTLTRAGFSLMGFALADYATAPTYMDVLHGSLTTFILGVSAINDIFNNDQDDEAELFAVWELMSYTVTMNGGGTGSSGAGSHEKDATVSINAGTRSGYSFTGWTVNSANATLASVSSAITTFKMPAANVTITANWRANTDQNNPQNPDPGPTPDPQPTPDPRPRPDPDPTPEPDPDPDPDPRPTPDPEPYTPPYQGPTEQTDRTVQETRPVPPQPQNGGSLIPGDNGGWIEVDDQGTPLGEWRWDPIGESWIFDPYVPLYSLPQTGLALRAPYVFALFGFSLLLTGIITRRVKKHKRGIGD